MLQRIVDDSTLKRQHDIKKKNRCDFDKCLKIFHLEFSILIKFCSILFGFLRNFERHSLIYFSIMLVDTLELIFIIALSL